MIYDLKPHTGTDKDAEKVHSYLAHNHGPANTLVAKVDGQILAVVGNNIGTGEIHSLQLLDDASTVPDKAYEAAADKPYPDGTDPALLPLFEAPGEWFDDVDVCLSAGGIGHIVDISPDGIHFSKYAVIRNHDRNEYFSDVADQFQNSNTIQDATVVTDKEEARNAVEGHTSRATWIDYTPRDEITIHEYVAFGTTVTNREEFVAEVSQILSHPPDFVDLFEQTRNVAMQDGFMETLHNE